MGSDNHDLLLLIGGVLAVLIVASLAGATLSRRVRSESGRHTVANLNARIRAWWAMCALFAVALLSGGRLSFTFFGVAAFLALREFLALAPTRPADHASLLGALFVLTPAQFVLAGAGQLGLAAILIPVAALFLLPARAVLAGDCERFLERTAVIQWGLMICVYNISFAPAILRLDVPGSPGAGAALLVFLVVVVQASDVLQYIWGTLLGRRRIAPRVSPNKTWEGFVGGTVSAVALGTALWWATPFTPLQAGALALLVALLGFAGGLILSAVKRDRGVKDYGTLVRGHGGVLDRLDSLCFAAPAFFFIARQLVA